MAAAEALHSHLRINLFCNKDKLCTFIKKLTNNEKDKQKNYDNIKNRQNEEIKERKK